MVQGIQPLSMTALLNRLFAIEKQIPNLYILNQTSVIINNICITGCTLWSKALVNIPKFIVRIHGINNEIYEKKHQNDVKYINNMIEYCNKKDLKLFVITHYCPTYNIVGSQRLKDKFISLYASNLDHLLDKQKIDTWCCGHIHRNFDYISNQSFYVIDTWCCGHIHRNFDYISNIGTRVVGNQRGKPRDRITDYKKDFVIEIE